MENNLTRFWDMNNFCHGESIWDHNLIWNITVPRFTRCFQHTIPVWVPSAVLWLLAPWQVYLMLKSGNSRPISYNLYNVSRLSLVLVVILTNAFRFGYELLEKEMLNPTLAELSSCVINVVTFTLFGFLLYLHRLHGHHTSGLAWTFSALSLIFSSPTVYMYAVFGAQDEGVKQNHFEFGLFFVQFVCLMFVFVQTCFADRRPSLLCRVKSTDLLLANKCSTNSISSKEELITKAQEECPTQSCSFLSYITFSWFTSLVWRGYRKPLVLKDLWALNPENSTSLIAPKFDRNWSSQKIRVEHQNQQSNYGTFESTEQNYCVDQLASRKKPNIVVTLAKTFKYELMSSAMAEFSICSLQFVSPQLLKILIGFVSATSIATKQPQWHGFVIAILLFIISTFISFSRTYVDRVGFTLRMRTRTALVSAIYRKSLTLSNSIRGGTTTGEIVNFMSTDAEHIAGIVFDVNTIWSAPVVLCLALAFLWTELGVAVLAGVGVLALMIPFNAWLLNCQERFQTKQMEAKDERVKVISEVLSGIRVIKLYGWEIPFISKVSSIRQREVTQIRNVTYLHAISSVIWTTAPYLVSLASFSAYVLMSDKNVLSPQKAFVSLALFELLRFPMTQIPELVAQLVMAWVSVKRLNRFLNSSQLEKYVTRDESCNAIEIENGTFSWEALKNDSEQKQNEPTKPKVTLSGINLKVQKGSLVAIVGHVGSGKSSLLSAILGDMERVHGTVNIANSETVAFVAQQAWIRNATLQDNILFGLPYIKSRLDSTIDMCALRPDLAILPGGDQTEIGEKGINLSGGQKQRVAIARACYSYASTILFDDPLSAVDSHVGQHIFQKVLSSKTGHLRDRTRVLVTNQISFLPEVDQIIVLSNGTITEVGTYEQLIASNGKFSEFVCEHSEKTYKKQMSIESSDEIVDSGTPGIDAEKPKFTEKSQAQLIGDENVEKGGVKLFVYGTYFRSWTWIVLAIAILGFVANKCAQVGSDVWLAIWANDFHITNSTVEEQKSLLNERLIGYGLFSLAQVVLFLFGAFGIAKGNVNSSIKLHQSLLDRIMRSPMHFFDTTPIGRIVNRFSRDIDTVDSQLAYNFDGVLTCILSVAATLLLICIKIPLFIIVFLPISLIYFFIQKFYIATYRQLTRIESVNKSPIFSHFAESLSGVSTIRAFDHSQRFVDESNRRVDTYQRCYFCSWNVNRWLCLRLEFCGNLVVLFTAFFAVLWHESLDPGFVGLVVTYSLTTTDMLNWMVRMTSAMESNLVSVERIDEYCKNATEREWKRKQNKSPELSSNWPKQGAIEFNDYSLRYREGLDLVLNSINVKIEAGEKVGIVGRTGAGKSSLTLALFRIVESAGGRIKIDGIEIDKIGLHELRDKLSIIPQDPVLFSGTIRTNLDPFNLYTDQLLWQALEHSHLKDFISSQEAGLNHVVSENGSNLSVGQRQLICLARALLRQTPILVLDEATAAIDLQTDALIQQTIRKEFAHCTVLTIAHRLNTIIDSTRVLVLDHGKVAEFDSPANLLANRKSKFYSLAKDAKIV